jgi:hypothetical protein
LIEDQIINVSKGYEGMKRKTVRPLIGTDSSGALP